MTCVLVAIPYRASLPADLQANMVQRAGMLGHHNPTLDLTLALYPNRIDPPAGSDAFTAHAQARNELLARYLRPEHDYVLWIDADVVAYPPDLPTRLLAFTHPAVVAPLVLIEGTRTFYDVFGFRLLNGQCVPPDFAPQWPTQLSEVGTCYLVPACLYHDSVRYVPTPGHTEHASVMQAAWARDWVIACDTTTTIYHADLSKYGLPWHTSLPVGAP